MTIHRRHDTEDGWRAAVYSECERYRYRLTVGWADGPQLLYVMLNPSKATELANDPTIERCERRARRLGYGSFGVVNLFAFRETSPARLKKARSPLGPDNMSEIAVALSECDHVLAAWGVHGAHRNQGQKLANLLQKTEKPVFHLGLTKHGHPRHPLYISYETPLRRWS